MSLVVSFKAPLVQDIMVTMVTRIHLLAQVSARLAQVSALLAQVLALLAQVSALVLPALEQVSALLAADSIYQVRATAIHVAVRNQKVRIMIASVETITWGGTLLWLVELGR